MSHITYPIQTHPTNLINLAPTYQDEIDDKIKSDMFER